MGSISETVLGEVALRAGGLVHGVDLGTLLRRLLLFDSVVVESIRLAEIPFLIRSFGKTGFLELFKSGVLKISYEPVTIATRFLEHGVPALPLAHFQLGLVKIANRDTHIEGVLRCLQSVPGLKNAERNALQDAVISGLTRPPSDFGAQLLAQVDEDVRRNAPVLKASVADRLRAEYEDRAPQSFELRVEEAQPRLFHLVSDLPGSMGISEEAEDSILLSAVGAVCRLNVRIAKMQAYSAITGFNDSEAPLLFGKFAGILSKKNPAPLEDRFSRVIAFAGLPDFEPGRRIDVEKLLAVRGSPECREFRSWLSGLERVSDGEIAERVSGLRVRIGELLRRPSGKALRFAVVTATGAMPAVGAVLGPLAGALDSFVAEKIFPSSGPVAFLRHDYPSLFRSDSS